MTTLAEAAESGRPPSDFTDARLGTKWSFDYARDIAPLIDHFWRIYGPRNMPRVFRFHWDHLPVFEGERRELHNPWHGPGYRELETDYGTFHLDPDDRMPRHVIAFYGPVVWHAIHAREED